MNKQKDKEEYNVEFGTYGIELDDEGKVIKHPLEYLYHFYPKPPITPSKTHELAFAGADLFQSSILNDVKLHEVRFYGEPLEIMDREIWANPLRVEVLESFAKKGFSWYFSFENYYTYSYFDDQKEEIPSEIPDYFSQKASQEKIWIEAYGIYGRRSGLQKRLFFEVRKDELNEVVDLIWPRAWECHTIQGYCFPSGNIDILRKWEQSPKDDKLFREIINFCEILFYTTPCEHRHFVFLSNKFSVRELEERIQIKNLRQKAEKLLIKEGYL